MRSRVEIVADVTDDGRPVLARLRSDGALAARATGPGRVHLVGAAAGPLDGDDLEVRVHVRAGASLTVRGVAATLALPRPSPAALPRPSQPAREPAAAELRLVLTVEDRATLDHAVPPLVVCRGARLRTTTSLQLAGSGAADLTDVVVLGRHGEDGGDWAGRLIVDRDGRPVLRTTQRSDVLSGEGGTRVLLSRFVTGGLLEHCSRAVSGGACRCLLATGDVLVSAVGPDVATALADVAALLT